MSGSDHILRQAVRASRIGIFENHHESGVIFWSARMREIHGWGPDEPITLEALAAIIHPDDLARFLDELRRSHQPPSDGATVSAAAIDHRIIRRDGSVRWLSMRGETEFAGEGETRYPVRTVGAVFDDTERREALQALALKDRAIDASLNAMAITDHEGRNIYVNQAFLTMWRIDTPDDVRGHLPTEFFHGPAAHLVFEAIQREGQWDGELVAIRRDGSTFDVKLSASAIRDANGRVLHTVATFLDISQEKALQAQYLQAQKMESVGRLAGGIAHDFNNLLTVIHGYVELSLGGIEPGSTLHRRLGQVRDAATSAAKLTRQLLAFSRKEIIDPQVLDLNEVLRHIQAMLPRLLGEDVRVVLQPGDGLWPVWFDPSQCDQILVNLAVNARDAMPDGGTLSFATENRTLGRGDVPGHVIAPGEYVVLTVTDTGTGMSDDVRQHLFEPFFTTKAPGRGTGLGLSMVYGAVSQNGGVIDVESAPGRGSSFRIYLPRAHRVRVTASDAFAELPRGNERVLVVEDDDEVRGLAEMALGQQGYEVAVCRSGHEAVNRLASGYQPDLLLTDVIMPEMNGHAVAERLTAMCPSVRVLYMSGYPQDVIAKHGVLDDGIEFLPKPYSISSLATKVRQVLDRR